MEGLKARLLSLLRERPHSAAELAARFGLTREAVDRVVADLRALGHAIASHADAVYRLDETLTEADLRAALERRGCRFGSVLEVHPIVASTNELARALADAGAPEGTVVVADEQTAGRGRQGRSWFSPPQCNLYFSLLLRPPIEPARAPLLTLAAAVAATDGIEAACGVRPDLKWPNDLQFEGRKVAGILCEMAARGDAIGWVVAGFGVNVNLDERHLPLELAARATSLKMLLHRPVCRAELFAAILAEAERWSDALYRQGPAPILDAWRKRTAMLGDPVCVRHGDETIAGTAADVDEAGALIVALPSGGTARVLAGDVELA